MVVNYVQWATESLKNLTRRSDFINKSSRSRGPSCSNISFSFCSNQIRLKESRKCRSSQIIFLAHRTELFFFSLKYLGGVWEIKWWPSKFRKKKLHFEWHLFSTKNDLNLPTNSSLRTEPWKFICNPSVPKNCHQQYESCMLIVIPDQKIRTSDNLKTWQCKPL